MIWYNNSWNYRKTITISNSGSALTDYQVLIIVDTATLVVAGKMQPDCRDIRFTDTDGSTLLPYWIESGQNTVSTKIWVKIPSISTSTKLIYTYYGNSGALATSDGTNTFLFFDDFLGTSLDSTKWDIINSPTITVASSIITITAGTVANTMIQSKASFPVNSSIRIKQKDLDQGGSHYPAEFGFGYRTYPTATNFVNRVAWTSSQSGFIAGNLIAESGNGGFINDYAWHTFDIFWITSKAQLWQDGTQKGTDITSNVPSATLPIIAGRTYSNGYWGNAQNIDWYLVRKYASPEPTFGASGTEETLTIITATNMTITTSQTPCLLGICTVTATVTWTNQGSVTGSFIPSLNIDGTPITSPYPSENLNGGASVTHAFDITNLVAGTHTICPNPN